MRLVTSSRAREQKPLFPKKGHHKSSEVGRYELSIDSVSPAGKSTLTLRFPQLRTCHVSKVTELTGAIVVWATGFARGYNEQNVHTSHNGKRELC